MSPILTGVIASGISGHLTPADTGAMFPLQVITVGAAGASSIEFTNIPTTGYSHLQIRAIHQTDRATYNTSALKLTLNGDTGNNYASHILQSDPASPSSLAIAAATSSTNSIAEISSSSTVASNTFGATVLDILDYANTNKYKTLRILSGADTNGAASGFAGWVGFSSGLWLNTNAVTSIKFVPQFGTNITQYSQFALYGVKGAA